MLGRRMLISLVLAVFVCAAFATSAAATAAGDFEVAIKRPPYVAVSSGEARYDYLDTSASTTIRLVQGTTELARASVAAGNSGVSASSAALQPGDRVEVYRPSIPAGPPGVGPVDEYVIPNLSVSGAAGASSISGTAPDGALARAAVGTSCAQNSEQSVPVAPIGGFFGSPTRALSAGVDLRLFVFSGSGDYTVYRTAVPGETPCFSAEAYTYNNGLPTTDPDAATPFSVRVSGLKDSVAADARLVWRRGATILGNVVATGDTSFSHKSATQPLPGDVLEVYRPQTATAPSRVETIPGPSATVDTAASLVAIQSPFASGSVEVFASDSGPSDRAGYRGFLALAAGRTLVDFNVPQSDNRAFKMNPGDSAVVSWTTADEGIAYSFGATPGDLVAPVISTTLKRKLRLSKIKKTISVTIRSSEIAAGTATIKIAKKLPGKGNPKTKPGKRTIKFATAKITLRAGSNKVKIKLSKAGLKALKQLRGAGKKMRPVKATLSVSVLDPTRNATTSARSFTLVVK